MENKMHTVGDIPNSNIKIAERVKIDTLNTQINDRSLPGLGASTSVKTSGGFKLLLWAQTSPQIQI